MVERTAAVVEHYGRDDLRERLSSALRTAGLSGQVLSPMILAPLDQFHVRGLAATKELAEAARVGPGAMVLDVGSGLGGPSRYLAATYGCHVTGIDLNASFVEAATYLAERAGFVDQVAYECADALALPYDDGRFDIAWTQHVAMNIEDRARLYGEVKRVLRPGGRFAVYDVVVGSGEALHFPVPWARNPRTSFLLTPDAMRTVLEQTGFRIVSWLDRTENGIAWFDEQQNAQATPGVLPGVLGLHIAMGPDFPSMSANLGRNLRERRIGLIQAVLEKP